MKILILGGNGFIGKNLCEYLRKQKQEVFSFDLTKPSKETEGIIYKEGDYFDTLILEEALRGMDVVVHAISLLTPSNSSEKYFWGYEREIVQLVRLCEMVAKQNQKLIFLSSGGTVYGEQSVQPIFEDASACPISHYGNVKLCMENTIRTFKRQSCLKAYIARIANPYGEGQDFHRGVGFIDAVVRNALQDIPIEIWGDGNNIRDYIYIGDVCKMLYALCKYEGVNDVFNLSTGIGTSQNQIVAYVSQRVGCVKVVYLDKRNVDVRTSILANNRILEIYDDQILSVEKGISNYIDYMKKHIKDNCGKGD